MINGVPDLQATRVTVMGLGLQGGGTGVTQHLCNRGADVTVTDLKSASDLAESLAEIDDLDINLTLGEHRPEDFSDADLVVVNPAVPLNSRYLEIARNHDVPLESEINLFVKQCPAPVIGITGTAGKSTTTAMIGNILSSRSDRTSWVGGNIGRSLLTDLDRIREDHHVVLEISSFQLLHLDQINWSPSTAVLTNIAPNHLDRHGTMEQYVRTKESILSDQSAGDVAVLNADDARLCDWDARTNASPLFFSSERSVAPGAWLKNGTVYFCEAPGAEPRPVLDAAELPVPGTFNVQNAMAATCAALSGPARPDDVRTGLRSFSPLPHHLENVARTNGVTFIDDSVATTPESTIEALSALDDQRTILIIGGYDKGADFGELAETACRITDGSVVLGDTADRLADVLKETDPEYPVQQVSELEDAVSAAVLLLNGRKGTVLLSPACASYDQFRNYRERGKTFRKLVNEGGFS